MKKNTSSLLIQLLLTPVVLMAMGLLLIFHPDFASAMIARVLGGILLALGTVRMISALVTKNAIAGKVLFSLVCFAIGGWLLGRPLELAAAIGRIVGILLTLRGIQDILNAAGWKSGMTYALISTLVGILLIVLPLTTSRLVMTLVGTVVFLLGIAMLFDRLRLYKEMNLPGEDNIIDAL